MRQSVYLATSDILIQWGGSTGYVAIDEYPDPDDANYNQDNGGSQLKDIFGFTGVVPNGAVITKITLKFRAQRGTYGRIRAAIRVGTTIYESANIDPGGTWVNLSYDWAANPVTSSPWKWYELVGLGPEANRLTGFGYGRNNTVSLPRAVLCSQCYLVVEYKNLSQSWIM